MSSRVRILEKILDSVESMLDVALDMDFNIEDKAEIHKALNKFMDSGAIQNMLKELGEEIACKRAPLTVDNKSSTNGIATDNKHIWVGTVDPNFPLVPMYNDTSFSKEDAEKLKQSMIDMIKQSISG